jgi:hypothetical protein
MPDLESGEVSAKVSLVGMITVWECVDEQLDLGKEAWWNLEHSCWLRGPCRGRREVAIFLWVEVEPRELFWHLR